VTTGPVGVGIIGAGMISDFYLENLTRFPDTNVLAIADIDLDRAKAAAEKWNVHPREQPRICSPTLTSRSCSI
jgi:predicted dehydrogenase